MGKIKIDATAVQNYGVGSTISFALVSHPTEGRKQLRGFDTCRDYINDTIIQFIHRKPEHHYNQWNATMPPVDMTKLRFAVAFDPPGKEALKTATMRLYSAKRILNMYEELAGFSSRSVLTRADHSCNKVKNCWLFTGPGEYMKSSHLISWATLVFRVVHKNGGFEEMTTLDEVEARFKKICTPYNCWSDLGDLLPAAWPKARMLFERYNEIFGDKEPEFFMPKSMIGSWHGPGGIRSLSTFKTEVTKIDKLIKQHWEEWSKDHPFHKENERKPNED